jgi:ABC-type maltose transport system permease subunit
MAQGRMAASVGQRRLDLTFRLIVIAFALIFALFPVLWIISAAFNPSGSMANQTLIPEGVESLDELLTNFRGLLVEDAAIHPFWRWVGNSILIASVSSIPTVMITALSAHRSPSPGDAGAVAVHPAGAGVSNMLAMVALYLILLQIGNLGPMPFYPLWNGSGWRHGPDLVHLRDGSTRG